MWNIQIVIQFGAEEVIKSRFYFCYEEIGSRKVTPKKEGIVYKYKRIISLKRTKPIRD